MQLAAEQRKHCREELFLFPLIIQRHRRYQNVDLHTCRCLPWWRHRLAPYPHHHHGQEVMLQ